MRNPPQEAEIEIPASVAPPAPPPPSPSTADNIPEEDPEVETCPKRTWSSGTDGRQNDLLDLRLARTQGIGTKIDSFLKIQPLAKGLGLDSK